MKKLILFIFLIGGLNASLLAQLSINAGNTDYTIDFDATLDGVNQGYYQGDGFVPGPSDGQVDSDAWATTGMSNGDSDFGDSNTTNDFARGIEPGNVITGGFYSFKLSENDYSFGIQPGGTDWTPGTVTLRIQNNTGFPMTSIDLAYDIYVLNNENRASTFNFSHSPDNIVYNDEESLDYTSVLLADSDPVWEANNKTITLTGFSIADGDYYYLRWSGDDLNGTDRRDEFALDNIVVNAEVDSNNPPVISNIENIPEAPNSTETVSITADITDGDGTINTVELRWGLTPGVLNITINMSVLSGDTYITNSDIPEQDNNTIVYYEIYAIDDDNESTTSPEQEYTVLDPVTATLPYEQTFDNDLGDCSTFSVLGDTKEWHWYDDGSARINGYNSGETEEDWLILPGIEFDDYSNEFMTFDTYFNYGDTDDETSHYLKLFYSNDYSGSGDPTTANWIEIAFDQPEDSQTWISSGILDLTSISEMAYIAFKYNYTDAYREWRVDNISIQEQTTNPEPTNYPTNFMAEAMGASSIKTNWTDDTIGMQLPTGYLILSNLSGTFTAPTDTVPVENDTDMSDGEGAMNIAYGVETYSWENLSASTRYYYTIYPYSNSGSTIDYKTDGDAPTADTITDDPAPVVINEINADPADLTGDANGDGIVDYSQDEFVEIVNSSSMAIDFSYYTLSDGFGVRHIFPSGTILQPNDAIVVFGGGTPTGFEYYEVQVASTGSLGLNNDGDEISIQDTSMTNIAFETYGPEGGDNQSLTRSPDVHGAFIKHTEADGADESQFSPNKFVDGSWFKTVTVWNGSQEDNDWDNMDNWSAGVPDSNSRTVLPAQLGNYPGLQATGPMSNSLFMGSDASLVGTQHLIMNGYAEVERTIDSSSGPTDGHHFLSSPVASFTIEGSDFEPVEGFDKLLEWDETTNDWLGYFNGFDDDEFEPGKGYLVAYSQELTAKFYGMLNTTEVIADLSFTAEAGNGWNFLGNPYTSAIDWDLLEKTEDVNGAVYVLQGSDNTYVSWNGETGDLTDGVIPVNNGFYVKSTSEMQSVIIDPASQVHGATGFMKNSNEEEGLHTLKISIANNNYTNNTYIQFRELASMDFDNDIDAYKLFGASMAPQLFTSFDLDPYSINCLPFSSEEVQLTMGFSNSVASDYTISAEGFETFLDQDFELILEDTETGNFIDIESGDYTFSAEDKDYLDRFILHFYGVTSTEETPYSGNTKIYSHEQTIFIGFDQLPKTDVDVKVYNLMGQQIYSNKFSPDYKHSFRLNEKPGYYLVKLSSSQNTWVEKVFIK